MTTPTRTITIIHCWSAPRSRSTALLYSFESRKDCIAAIDEPLYRPWLQYHHQPDGEDARTSTTTNTTTTTRPYTQSLLHGTPHPETPPEDNWRWEREQDSLDARIQNAVAESVEGGGNGEEEEDDGIIFVKHMAKHCDHYDFRRPFSSLLPSVRIVHRHILLIRDPTDVLSSWSALSSIHGQISSEEVGMVHLLSLYSRLSSSSSSSSSASGHLPYVLDSDWLVQDPTGALRHLCEGGGDYEGLGIPYDGAMMEWKSGKHRCDGPWGNWWYGNVRKTNGWNSIVNGGGGAGHLAAGGYSTLDPELVPALRLALPSYEFLWRMTVGYGRRRIGVGEGSLYEDERNGDLLVWVGAVGRGRLVPRECAGLSPWDSSVQGGDAVWEGLRIYNGKILSLTSHLQRLHHSAHALHFQNIPSSSEITHAIFRTLAANGMRDGAHIRLTLTRGEKSTSSMNPTFNVYGTTLIVLPEWKPTQGRTTYDNEAGISLITSSVRRNSPQTGVDSKIHHNNMINNILPKIQANQAGVADALMLDVHGFVSETNATNVFMVGMKEGGGGAVLVTPTADACLPGITRGTVIRLAREDVGMDVEVRNVSVVEFYGAEEVFTTGTMGELTPVVCIDGRMIGGGRRGAGPVTKKLQELYRGLPERPGWATEIPPFE